MKHNHVGIDVSAKTFTTIIDYEGERTEAFDLPNDAKGFKKLIRMITKKGFTAQVVLEATGNYSLDLALAVHRTKRIEVMVANPRAIALDANVIVEFSIRMPFEAWKPPETHCFNLRAISRRIEALPVGHVGEQTLSNQPPRQRPSASSALLAGPGRRTTRASRDGLLPETSRERQDQDAGERGRHAKAAPCNLWNAEARSTLRWGEVLCVRGLTLNRVSNGSGFSGRQWFALGPEMAMCARDYQKQATPTHESGRWCRR